MNDDEIRMALREAPTPAPVGGHDAARERLFGKLRHRFPPSGKPVKRGSVLRPLVGSLLALGVAATVFLAWPEPSAEADPLPSESQMSRFYDQHETHLAAHFREEEELRAR